jgi:hypothetical protein
MPEYLVELYSVAQADAAALAGLGDGQSVRYLRSIVIPGDETCLHLVLADCVEQVAKACAQAGLQPDRIVEAIGMQAATPTDNPNR